jgi:hypothetical protein
MAESTSPAPVADKYADWPEETWTYGGLRVTAKGARRHVWIEPDGTPGLYTDKGRFVVGGLYTVRVDRTDGTTRTTPHYTGETADAPQRAELEARDHAARKALAAAARERSDAAKSALDAALEPVLDIARNLHGGAELEALASYVMRRIYTPGARPKAIR